MSFEWVEDDSGERMWMQRIHKNRLSGRTFIADTIENMIHVTLRDDDILLCTYPKCGTHWVFENLRCLVSGQILNDDVEKKTTMMEFYPHGHFDNFPSPRILNTHVFYDDMPSDMLKGKAKVVMVYRNPKDVAVSFYHHHSRIKSYKYQGVFKNYVRRFAQGKVSSNCCFDYWKMWEEGLLKNPQIPCHLVRYEDLHLDPIGERRRLATFLGKEYDDAFLNAVNEVTSIDSMRKNKLETSLKDAEGNSIWYRKGQVGDWKNYFTVNDSEWFDQVVEKEMGNSKLFKFIYSID